MQRHLNLVDLVKSFPTNIFLQILASIQKRTSPIKFAHFAEKSEKGSTTNLSTKVPEAALGGHAFHTYALRGPDTTFQIQHNVCGRVPYAEGTVDAVEYLVRLGPFFFFAPSASSAEPPLTFLLSVPRKRAHFLIQDEFTFTDEKRSLRINLISLSTTHFHCGRKGTELTGTGRFRFESAQAGEIGLLHG